MTMPIPPKHARILARLRERGEVRRAGGEWRTRCPAHDDGSPSLYIALSLDRKNTLLDCKAGCDAEDIVAALDMTLDDLFHHEDELVEVEAEFDSIDVVPTAEEASIVSAPGYAEEATDPGGNPPRGIADPAVRHEVYSQLLGGLTLVGAHRQDLARRGLGEADIDRLGYRSLGRFALNQAVGQLKLRFDDATLLGVPGFRPRKGRVRFVDIEGLLVPVRDREGRVVALKVRADRGGDGPKYLWVSSVDEGGPSPGSPPHVPLETPVPATTIRLTEGELKADVSSRLSGMPTIGVSGVSNWRPSLPILEALGARVVHLAFDADARTKSAVARDLAACADGLIGAGFEVRLELWKPEDGKGIDDLLAAGKQPEVVAGRQVLAVLNAMTKTSGSTATEEEDWVPEDPGGAVAPFPSECLPAAVARFVAETARATQCPADFPGMGVLAVAAAAVGGSRRLRVRRGYDEVTSLYVAIVARPGDGKSPALRAACAPIYAQQRRKAETYRRDKVQFEADLEAYEAARRKRPREDDLPPDAPERPVRPSMDHIFAGDVTAEGLAQILARTPRGLLMIRDELTGWVMSMNQYKGGRGADRQFYLSCWSGEPAKVDRKSDRGEPLMVPDPSLSVVGCIPPALLAELDAGNDGQDGFIHRVLFANPEPVPHRRWSWHGLSPATRKGWEDVVARLYDLAMGRDEHGQPTARILDLAPEACPSWEAWYNAHAEESEAPDFPDVLVGPWSKLIAYAARLALIVHLLRWACGEPVGSDVDAESLGRALKLVTYFKSHARAVYARLRHSEADRRVRLAIAWIREHGGECSPTHLARNNVAGVQKKSEAVALMRELEDRGYGRLEVRKAANHHKVSWFVAKKGEAVTVGSNRVP